MVEVPCPGCGLALPDAGSPPDERFNASAACRQLCFQLSYYTISLGDPFFLPQLAVDAYAAQHGGAHVKPKTVPFALVGLYLVWERGFTGRQVQRVHVARARTSAEWPQLIAPLDKSWLTVQYPAESPDEKKAAAIGEWSRSVWDRWREEAETVRKLLARVGME